MKGTVVYPGHTLNGARVDIVGFKGPVDLGGGFISEGPHALVRRQGVEDGLLMCLTMKQVVIDEPGFDPHAPIESLSAHFTEANRVMKERLGR